VTIFWTVWLFVLVPVSFAAAEFYAIWSGKKTLSRYVWTLSQAWPPFPWLVGVVVGFLACHFFWYCQGCPLVGGAP
jgi:hypothetical protein